MRAGESGFMPVDDPRLIHLETFGRFRRLEGIDPPAHPWPSMGPWGCEIVLIEYDISNSNCNSIFILIHITLTWNYQEAVDTLLLEGSGGAESCKHH